MSRLQTVFETKRFPLFVSLPRNSVEMAKAAEDNGADCLKVHTALTVSVSGITFGTLDEERHNLESILRAVTVPVGIVPGRGVDVDLQEIKQMEEMGFDFFDCFLQETTPLFFTRGKLGRMLCVTREHSLDMARAASELPGVVCVEADIAMQHGGRPSMEEFVRYRLLAEAMRRPLVVPTQRYLIPEDVKVLATMGARALLIGVVVTGDTVEGVARVTRAFRQAIDALN